MKSVATGLAVRPFRALLGCSAAAFALALSGAAWAQDDAQPAEEEFEGNEIVVTATKREQTLQEIPVAVSVTTAESIERAQIRDIRDLGSLVPSLRVAERQSTANANFTIRGFGNGANNAGIEPSVGVFIDGVYRSRAASQVGDLPDVARVEVLRGPQSTLFGKNASAGVISVVTQKPKFQLGGNIEASYGNYNALVVKGVVTGPLGETVAASIAGGINKRDGWARDLGTGNRTQDRDRWFVRGQLLFEPTDDLSIRLIGDYSKIDETCCAVVNLRTGPATGALIALGGRVNNPATPFANEVYSNLDSITRIKAWGGSGQIDYDLGGAKLTSITSYRGNDSFSNQDSDFTSGDLLGRNDNTTDIKTFTQEFRITGDLMDKLSGLLGAFYFNEKIAVQSDLLWGANARSFANLLVQGASGGALNVPLLEQTFGGLEAAAAQNPALAAKYTNRFFANATGQDQNFRFKNNAFSIFGQLDFEVADRVTLTGGLNYTRDKKNYSANVASTDVFSTIDFNSPIYAPFRNQLLFQGGLASQVGTLLGLGRSASAAEIGAFAGRSPAVFQQVAAGVQAFATANQNNPAANPLNGLKPLQFMLPFLNVPNAVEPGKTSDSNVSWTARLAFDATDSINVYVGAATGFKASSINLSRDSRPPASILGALTAAGLPRTNQTYGSRSADPEKSRVYELGIKANWDVATANLAVFKQTIRGFQSNLFVGTGFFLANAGKQSATGFEFEGSVRPTDELTLGMSVTYLDSQYDKFVLSAVGDLSGLEAPDVPPVTASFSADYKRELASGDKVMVHFDYLVASPVQTVEGLPGFLVRNAAGVITDSSIAIAQAAAYKRKTSDMNASLTYALNMGVELSIWGRNLLDTRTIPVVFDSPAQNGSISGYINQPRTYGAAVRYRF